MIQTATTPLTPAITRRPITQADLDEWRRLRAEGYTYDMIAKHAGRSHGGIYAAMQRGTPTDRSYDGNLSYGYKALHNPAPAPRSDHPRLGADVAAVELPPVVRIPGPLRLALNEKWCRNCGDVIGPWMERENGGFRLSCCGRPDPVMARDILQPGEYVEPA